MIQPNFLLMVWIQTIPITLLAFSAFEEEELRWPRKYCHLASVVYMTAACVILAAASGAASVGGQRNEAARNLGMSVLMAVYSCGYFALVRAPALRKVLAAGMLIHYAAVLNALGSLFTALILGEGYLAAIWAEAGSLCFDLCLLGATVLTWPFVWRFFRRTLRKNLPAMEERETRRGFGYMLAALALFCASSSYIPFEKYPAGLLVTLALVATEAIVYHIFFQELGAVKKQAETARQLQIYQMQYREISSRMEEAARLRHDLRHHLNALGALNARGNQAGITEYLKRYGTVYDRLEEERLCGDPVADSVLGYYLAQAEEAGIRVEREIHLKGETGIDPVDMTVLLGNCLENAMEALEKLPREERRLSIELQPAGAVLLLRVTNPCADPGDTGEFAGWERFSPYRRRDGHGMGLKSIAGIAEKYGGSAQFQRRDGVFTARVVLNLPG